MIIKPCKPVHGLFSATKTLLKFFNDNQNSIEYLRRQKLKSRLNNVDFLIDRLFTRGALP